MKSRPAKRPRTNVKTSVLRMLRPTIKVLRASPLVRRGVAAISPRLRDRMESAAVDCMMVSFPKCGRTWLRFMLGEVFCRHFGVEVEDMTALTQHSLRHPRAPCVRATHDLDPHLRTPEEISVDARGYAGRKVIFLMRDPRDVLVSLFFQATRRRQFDKPGLPRPTRVGDLITQKRGGLESLLRFYNLWGEACRQHGACLAVRYEDMKRDTEGELKRVLAFLDVDASDGVVKAAVAAGSFENMRAIESAGADTSGRLKPGDPTDEDSFKVRRGVVGGYREYLSPEEIAIMDEVIASQLSDFFADYKSRPSAARSA